MKDFFKKHSYDMVKMFLNQFATAIFGFSLVLAAGKAESQTLRIATSIGAILFYVFLLYTMTWDIGYRDKVSVETGRIRNSPFKGALISLCANSLNFLLAIFIMLASLLPESFISDVGGISVSVALLLEGMYTGLLAIKLGGVAISSYWFVYFLLPIPAIVTCFLGYQAGLHDIKLTGFFNYKEPSKAKEKKESADDEASDL